MSGRVVVDTNILVRTVLSGTGSRDAIIAKIGFGNWRLVYGKEQLDELLEVLGYPRIQKRYQLDQLVIQELIGWIVDFGREINPVKVILCRDPDDNYIIGLAMKMAKKGKVYLVTADKDILELKGKINQVEILTPGKFLQMGEL